jgi:hypothetical protein
MTVNQVLWFENPDKPEEGPETLVTSILFIVNALGRRVCQKYIKKTSMKKPVKEQARNKFYDFQVHLQFGKLVWPFVVPHGSAQPGDNQPFSLPHFRADMNSSAASICLVIQFLHVVIPKNEKQGFIQTGNYKVKVIQRKIPRTEHYFHIGKTVFD